jgi:methyltransferase family protein
MHLYDRAYYNYINDGSMRSAEVLLPIVTRHLAVRSVADFGAGQGVWLSVWRRLGVTDLTALDGAYVDQDALFVPKPSFVATDLSQQVRLGRTFDLVQSLEVAEHLPAVAAEQFVDNLVTHSSIVLFSAAVPGQGGEHHVNEQPYSYWRQLFSDRGYVMFDLVRPFLLGRRIVEPWYRFNTFVYIARERLATLPEAIRAFQIDSHGEIADVSPFSYRVRKMAVRMLPFRAVTGLATLKKQLHRARCNAQPRRCVWYDA